MSLKRHLSRPWVAPAVLALVVALVGFWARRELHDSTERKVGDLLRVVCDSNVAALTTWMTAKEREADLDGRATPTHLAEAPRTQVAARPPSD